MNFSLNSTNRWLRYERHCAWPEVRCSNGTVVQLLLGDGGIGGTIPTEGLSSLTKLELLDFRESPRCRKEYFALLLTGASCLTLRHDNTGNNSLTGTIPTELRDLTDLVFLSFCECLFGWEQMV